uniref:NADH:quinone oxidoreductase/Mrp antiporter membrane subunit domain-containing protein n=1 Tax=Oryza rufipogon TaxID=4529 RepID=A0A0E0RI22_ORYRU
MRSFGKEYITAFLIREFLMIAVSCMLDPLLFYIDLKKIIAYSSVAHMNLDYMKSKSINPFFYVLVFYMTDIRLDLLDIMEV